MGVSSVNHANQTGSGPLTAEAVARSVRSFIVLSGAVRRTPLARSIRRSLVDLPLADGSTLAERHLAGAERFATRWGLDSLSVRLLVDAEARAPAEHAPRGPVRCVVERDASPIRGVAGILADATRDHDPDEYVVVVNGAQVFRQPMDELVEAMARMEPDVALVSSADGTPVGLWLIRCGVLRSVRSVGYVDLKEQSLPEWVGRWKVSVVERQRAYALRTRNITEYLGAVLSDASGELAGSSVDEDPYREEWERSFAIVEAAADVKEGTKIHDSVVLTGGSVGRDAVVVRSVVCPGGVVAAGSRCVGRVVGSGAEP
jgi:hypothetical protein